METLFEKYCRQLRTLFDWPEIVAEARKGWEDTEHRYVYLDTLFSLMPSRKAYPPDVSNSYAPCARCLGTGKLSTKEPCSLCDGVGSYEQLQDSEYWRALESVADEHGLWVARGEEDRYSVFAGLKFFALRDAA